jgi:hypothetical protein
MNKLLILKVRKNNNSNIFVVYSCTVVAIELQLRTMFKIYA